MGNVEHYPLSNHKADNFLADTLPEALEAVATWIRQNPHYSILAIAIKAMKDFEEVTVFYEDI